MRTHDEHMCTHICSLSRVSAAGASAGGSGAGVRAGGLSRSGGQDGLLEGAAPTDICGKGTRV